MLNVLFYGYVMQSNLILIGNLSLINVVVLYLLGDL